MWRIFRPDALAVLRDNRARSSLRRYFEVMEDKAPAKAQVCRRVPAGVELEAREEELWKAHARGMEEFKRVLKALEEGKLELGDLEVKDPSLLDLKAELARRMLGSCRFCERRCGVNRSSGEKGVCGVGERSRVASEFMHHGEEPELVPSYTIFFSGCTFRCCFCQNWDISQYPENGVETSPRTLASLAATHRRDGARNVNWVGGEPTPNLHNILEALAGLEVNLPSVWNSNMYMSEETMELLAGTQDVYLTDFKYGSDGCALRCSSAPDYWRVVTRNHKLAHRDAELIIRHLVLPGHLECCTRPILGWIAKNLGRGVRVNVMGQYRPEYKAQDFPELARRPSSEEMERALAIAREAGLENVIT